MHLDPSDVGVNEASRQTLIEVLPPVLVIHLKRFLYDPAAGSLVKVGKPIRFAGATSPTWYDFHLSLEVDAENP